MYRRTAEPPPCYFFRAFGKLRGYALFFEGPLPQVAQFMFPMLSQVVPLMHPYMHSYLILAFPGVLGAAICA